MNGPLIEKFVLNIIQIFFTFTSASKSAALSKESWIKRFMSKIIVNNKSQSFLNDEIEKILKETCQIISLYMKIKMNF